jgi:hypothetical protein
MNKRLAILVALLAVLTALAWYLNRGRGGSSLAAPLSDFMVADTSRVDRIFIAGTDGQFVDLRRQPEGWTVERGAERYPAKAYYVGLLLKTLLRVEVRSPVPKSSEEHILRVMSSGAKKVEIYTGGRQPLKTWIIGPGTKDNLGTYMLLEKPGVGRSSVPFIVGMSGFSGVLNTRFHTNLDDWRASTVFRFNDLYDLASVTVEDPSGPTNTYTIEHQDRGQVRLLDHAGNPLPCDTVLVKAALLPFQELNWDGIERRLPPDVRDSLLASTPHHRLVVRHRNGKEERSAFWYMPDPEAMVDPGTGRPPIDRLYMHALVQDTLLVVVQRQHFDRVLLPLGAFLPRN